MGVDTTRIFDQTSRTILFEKFSEDDSAYSLARLVSQFEDGNGKIGMGGEDALKKQLTVHSFEEFLEKFAPPVYEIIMQPPVDEDGNTIGPPRFVYTLDKNEADKFYHQEPRRLNKHLYYDMIMQIYRDKCDSRQSDYEYDDSQILKMITPQQEVKRLARLRKELEDNRALCYFGETSANSRAKMFPLTLTSTTTRLTKSRRLPPISS